MKIIKNGYKELTAQVTCEYCNSILEVNPTDIKQSEENFSFRCPVCKMTAGLEKNPFKVFIKEEN